MLRVLGIAAAVLVLAGLGQVAAAAPGHPIMTRVGHGASRSLHALGHGLHTLGHKLGHAMRSHHPHHR